MPPVLDLELARLRAMTTTEKIGVMDALWREAWLLTAAGVRGRHAGWSDDEVAAEARKIIGRGGE